jgi:hypothetical protein
VIIVGGLTVGDSTRNGLKVLKRSVWLPALVLLIAPAAAPQAYASQLSARGKTGASSVLRGSCTYGVFGPRGILTVGVAPPIVSGANTKRRTRRERTYVRYRVEVTDASRGYATLTSSSWSSKILVRQNGSRTWTGTTFLQMDWRGSYGADVLIEWRTSRRRVGWRWHRLTAFSYYDHYNRGPFGPFTYCFRNNSPFN